MNLKEYQKKARSTAIYNIGDTYKVDMTMLYPALGLMGECGEVAEKIKKLFRDDGGSFASDRKHTLQKELGDCCWYLANICCDINFDLQMAYEMRTASQIQEARKMELPRLTFRIGQCAAKITEAIEKWYYKYRACQTENVRFTDIPHNITKILVCLEEMAIRCDSTLEEVCLANIEKLLSRKVRGKLKGDGDDR